LTIVLVTEINKGIKTKDQSPRIYIEPIEKIQVNLDVYSSKRGSEREPQVWHLLSLFYSYLFCIYSEKIDLIELVKKKKKIIYFRNIIFFFFLIF
jgi:hypothetical protein